MRLVQSLFVVGALLFIFGIGFVVVGARTARQAPPPPRQTLTPVASVKQLMNGMITPSAGAVFDSVSTIVDIKGVEEKFPRDDAEWAMVGNAAATLAEAGNLMMMEGRAVDQGEWIKISQAMIDAAKQTLKAVDAKSPEAVLEAGSAIYDSCNNCHKQYQRQ
jgi:hypothetical protein